MVCSGESKRALSRIKTWVALGKYWAIIGQILVPRPRIELGTRGFSVRCSTYKMLNKMTVSHLSELSNLSKSYISQVKNGKRPPSEKLLNALLNASKDNNDKYNQIDRTIGLFLDSRREGTSNRTIYDFYWKYLSKAIPKLGLKPTPNRISDYLSSLKCSMGGKQAYFRAMRAFYNWLYSPKANLQLHPEDNPVTWVEAPKVGKIILPSLTKEQVKYLIDKVNDSRDKAIISLFSESGLRLSELTGIKTQDIDWEHRIIKVLGKGKKEAYAPFGQLTERYLREWLASCNPNGDNIWGLNSWGIVSMLRRLEKETGLPCNPHTFRRTFACLLRKAGVDTMTIKDLGRWESLEMVQRYTRSVTFHDSLKFYKAPLS